MKFVCFSNDSDRNNLNVKPKCLMQIRIFKSREDVVCYSDANSHGPRFKIDKIETISYAYGT